MALVTKTYNITNTVNDGYFDEMAYSINNTTGLSCSYDQDANYSTHIYTRFIGIDIPKNTVISSAKIQLNLQTYQNAMILSPAILDADAVPQVNTREDYTNVTNASNYPRINLSNVAVSSNSLIEIDIKSSLQQVLNRTGWVSGNSVFMFAMMDYLSGNSWYTNVIHSYDTNQSLAPKLIVTYNVSNAITKTYQINNYADDGIINSKAGIFNEYTDYQYLGANASNDMSGYLLFKSIDIPIGATIDEAHVEYYSTGTSPASTIYTRVYANALDNPTAPTSISDYNGRTVTTNYSNWTVPATSTGTWVSTANIKSVIQEVVQRSGWQNGNSILILHKNNGSTDVNLDFASYDYGATYAPKLVVTYTPDTTPPSAVTNAYAVKFDEISIGVAWTNPSDTDFKEVKLYHVEPARSLIYQGSNSGYLDFSSVYQSQLYEIVAVDKAGNESSAVTITYTPAGAGTNTSVSAVRMTSTVAFKTVTVNAVKNISITSPKMSSSSSFKAPTVSLTQNGYVIERSIDNVIFTQIALVPYGTNEFIDTNVTDGTTYYYRIKRVDNTLESSWSNTTSLLYGEFKINIVSFTKSKISDETGMTVSTVIFQSTQNLQQWEARADGSGVGQGSLVGSGTTVTANTDVTFDVDYTELTWGDKTYRINIYGKNMIGEWSTYE